MTPVEATTTSEGRHPSAFAVTAAISRASARPPSPVAAFAQPALITTARARPDATCSRDTITGAAGARLSVKTAAAAHSRSAASSARSAPSGLIPAATEAARKPSGAVIAPRASAAERATGFAFSCATLIRGSPPSRPAF